LSWGPPTLLNIADSAASHYIVPAVFSPLNFRNNMIYGQLIGSKIMTTILAGENIPNQDIFSGKWDLSTIHLSNEFEEPDYGRNPKSP
jgi:hypothetical protein